MYSLGESRVSHLPILSLHVQSSQNRPKIAIIGIVLQRFVESLGSCYGIVFIKIDLGLEDISHINVGPTLHDVVEIIVSLLIVLQKNGNRHD